MSITAEKKQELVKKFARSEGDTGSPEVQVAILTERISNLTEHFKDNKKRQSLPSWPPENGRNTPEAAGLCKVP